MRKIQLILLLTLLSVNLISQEQSKIEKKNAVSVNTFFYVGWYPYFDVSPFNMTSTVINYSRTFGQSKIGHFQSSIGIGSNFLFLRKNRDFGTDMLIDFSLTHYFGKKNNHWFVGGKLDWGLRIPRFTFSTPLGYYYTFKKNFFLKLSMAPKIWNIYHSESDWGEEYRYYSNIGSECFIAFELGYKF